MHPQRGFSFNRREKTMKSSFLGLVFLLAPSVGAQDTQLPKVIPAGSSQALSAIARFELESRNANATTIDKWSPENLLDKSKLQGTKWTTADLVKKDKI